MNENIVNDLLKSLTAICIAKAQEGEESIQIPHDWLIELIGDEEVIETFMDGLEEDLAVYDCEVVTI